MKKHTMGIHRGNKLSKAPSKASPCVVPTYVNWVSNVHIVNTLI